MELDHLEMSPQPDVKMERITASIVNHLRAAEEAIAYEQQSSSQSQFQPRPAKIIQNNKPVMGCGGGGNLVTLPGARSEVWSYFGFQGNDRGEIVDRSRIICKLCNIQLTYSGNTTNPFNHLSSMHPDLIVNKHPSHSRKRKISPLEQANNQLGEKRRLSNSSILQTPPQESSSSVFRTQRVVNTSHMRTSSVLPFPLVELNYDSSSSSSDSELDIPMQIPDWLRNSGVRSSKHVKRSLQLENNGTSHSQLNNNSGTGNKEQTLTAEELTKNLAKFLVKDFRPLSLIYSEGFKSFLRSLAPDYEIPNKTIMKPYLQKEIKTMYKSFKHQMQHPALEAPTISQAWT